MLQHKHPDLFVYEFASSKELTVLSYGAGQQSTWLLYKCALSQDFREQFAPNRLLVLGCDTGDEHDETYRHIDFTREFCQLHGIEFYWLEPDMEFHFLA